MPRERMPPSDLPPNEPETRRGDVLELIDDDVGRVLVLIHGYGEQECEYLGPRPPREGEPVRVAWQPEASTWRVLNVVSDLPEDPVIVRVTANADDGLWSPDGGATPNFSNSAVLHIHNADTGTGWHASWARFTETPWEQGEDVGDLLVRFVGAFSDGPSSLRCEIAAHAVDDATNPTSLSDAEQQWSERTAAVVEWNRDGFTVQAGEIVHTTNVRAVVQEIVDREGWEPGNALLLLFRPTAQTFSDSPVYRFDSHDQEPAHAPALVRPGQTTPLGAVAHDDLAGVEPDQHHAEDHAARHAQDGPDELRVDDLGAGSTNTNHVLRPDGSGGAAFVAPAPPVVEALVTSETDITRVLRPDGSGGVQWGTGNGGGGSGLRTVTFGLAGELATGKLAPRVSAPADMQVASVRLTVRGAPVASAVIVNCYINGVSMWDTADGRPRVQDGQTSGSATPTFGAINEDDILEADIDQVGSSEPGSDLLIQIRCVEV